MSFTILKRGQAKRDIIREVGEAWVEKCPVLAREMADYLTEITKVERAKIVSAEGTESEVTLRVPQDLFLTIRCFLPDFGNDDEDIKILCDEFPKLVQFKRK